MYKCIDPQNFNVWTVFGFFIFWIEKAYMNVFYPFSSMKSQKLYKDPPKHIRVTTWPVTSKHGGGVEGGGFVTDFEARPSNARKFQNYYLCYSNWDTASATCIYINVGRNTVVIWLSVRRFLSWFEIHVHFSNIWQPFGHIQIWPIFIHFN